MKNDIKYTTDDFYITIKPLSEILMEAGIDYLCEDLNNIESRPVSFYYDDWYIMAVPHGNDYTYGLFKMREQEIDGYDGDDPGVTISFVEFNINLLLQCISNPSTANRYYLLSQLDQVTGPGSFDHSESLAAYFRNPASKGSYLIAEEYVKFIAGTSVNGYIYAPNKYRERLAELEEVIEAILIENDLDELRVLAYRLETLQRIPNAINSNNTAAGYEVYNTNTNQIIIRNPNSLSIYEKYAILATHTANVTFNSFAAEVLYHADFLDSIGAIWPSNYERALRADMGIGEEYESGITDQYYDLDSDIVQEQIDYHGEY